MVTSTGKSPHAVCVTVTLGWRRIMGGSGMEINEDLRLIFDSFKNRVL
jgi:hypothetical protein